VLLCGDPHGKFTHIVSTALDLDASAVVLLGDLQPSRPLHQELEKIADRVWFIHGNHDTDSNRDFESVFDSALSHRNLHGRVVALPDGTRIAGLGGVFRESVWHPSSPRPKHRSRDELTKASAPRDRWRDGPPRQHWFTIFPVDIDHLSALRADVLVTHEAGAAHPHGFEIIVDLARAMGASVTFHGHHHDLLDYSSRWQGLGFRSFGVGLGGISDLNGTVVVPGELDHVRQFRRRNNPLE
jgi:predicted phosphodiesterase